MIGYSLDAIVDMVESYTKDGIDKGSAMQAAVAIARGAWKRDNPHTTNMPNHLRPGNVVRSIKEAMERRGEGAAEDTGIE